jgi:hypothetical protein
MHTGYIVLLIVLLAASGMNWLTCSILNEYWLPVRDIVD